MKFNLAKRIAPVMLALAMTFAAVPVMGATAMPTSQDRTTIAQSLNQLGLFAGYDSTGTNFGLTDDVTREQALVFMIRLLGEDVAAKAWNGTDNFQDVAKNHWAYSYIGYAKEKGYTAGLGDGNFGIGKKANIQEMTTYVLRGLGYSDAAATNDFNVQTSLDFAKSKGISSSSGSTSALVRGDVVEIMFTALAANMKGQEIDLLTKLINAGAVTQQQFDAALAIVQAASQNNPTTAPATTTPEAPATTAATDGKQISDRLDKALARYNTLIEKFDKYDALLGDSELVKDISAVSDSIDKMSTEVGDGSKTFTAEQLAGYTKDLDALDSFMNELEKLIQTAESAQSGTSTTAAPDGKAIVARYDKLFDRYSKLIEEFNKNDKLTSDEELVKNVSAVSDSMDLITKTLGDGSKIKTAEDAEAITKGLDTLESFINDLEELIKAAK